MYEIKGKVEYYGISVFYKIWEYYLDNKNTFSIKALLVEPDGMVLIYKRLTAEGRYRWPRNKNEVRNLTWREFDWLMSGLDIEQPKAIKMNS